MQWNGGKNCGFSEADKDKLYICQDEDESRPDAEAQIQDPDSLWHEVRRLTALRKEHPALLAFGGFSVIYAEKNKYPRTAETETVWVVLNPSDREITLEKEDITQIPEDAEAFYHIHEPAVYHSGRLCVPAQSATFFIR